MGILEVLLIIFVVLKLTHTIDWSWWLVLLPLIIDVVLYVFLLLTSAVFAAAVSRKVRR